MSCRASVIVPVFNAEKTLRRCVESLVLGLERDIEVILVDDCSSDSSWEVCQVLATEFSHVICIRNEKNSGVSYTRNQGLAAAQGTYILFADSDDWVSEHYARALLDLAEQNRDSLPICGQHFIDKVSGVRQVYTWSEDPGAVHIVPAERFFELSDKFLLQQLWNKIFRRDIIEAAHIRFDEDQSMGEDFQFVLDYMEAMHCQKCAILNAPLYYYIRWNHSSLMSKFGFIQIQNEFDRLEQLSRLSGSRSTRNLDATISQLKRNYVYHIVRNRQHTRQEKIEMIEKIMADGNAAVHYRRQKLLFAKESAAVAYTKLRGIGPRIKGALRRKVLAQKTARFRDSITASDITIISQNCIGGVLYHDMGMQFLSPTVNTFIEEPDFVKLCCNLRHYMDQPLQMRWEEEYPVGRLDNIEIHFMHYETCKEAKDAWERRKQRINWDKVIILSTDRDGFDDDAYELWKDIPYTKVLFTANRKYAEDRNSVFFSDSTGTGCVSDLISNRDFYKAETLVYKLNGL